MESSSSSRPSKERNISFSTMQTSNRMSERNPDNEPATPISLTPDNPTPAPTPSDLEESLTNDPISHQDHSNNETAQNLESAVRRSGPSRSASRGRRRGRVARVTFPRGRRARVAAATTENIEAASTEPGPHIERGNNASGNAIHEPFLNVGNTDPINAFRRNFNGGLLPTATHAEVVSFLSQVSGVHPAVAHGELIHFLSHLSGWNLPPGFNMIGQEEMAGTRWNPEEDSAVVWETDSDESGGSANEDQSSDEDGSTSGEERAESQDEEADYITNQIARLRRGPPRRDPGSLEESDRSFTGSEDREFIDERARAEERIDRLESAIPQLESTPRPQSSAGATTGSTAATDDAVMPITGNIIHPRGQEQLMREMVADIQRYDRQRESELEREYGYSRWSPESSPERYTLRSSSVAIRQAVRSMAPRGRWDLGGDEGDLGAVATLASLPVLEGSTVNERQRQQRIRNVRAGLAEGFGNGEQADSRQPLQRLAMDQPDPSDEFLRMLIASHPPYSYEMEAHDEDTMLTETQRAFRYGFADPSIPMTQQQEDDFQDLRFDLRTRLESVALGMEIVVRMLDAVILDGMDRRDASHILLQWSLYMSGLHAAQLYHNLPYMLPPPVLALWTAVRRGWGSWSPDASFLEEVKDILQGYTVFDYRIDVDPTSLERNGLLSNVRLSALPPEEKAFFEELIEQRSNKLVSVAIVFRDWAMFAPTIDDTMRLESEQHFSRNQLRMDRLARLVREERAINADGIDLKHYVTSREEISPGGQLVMQVRSQIRWSHRPVWQEQDPGSAFLKFLCYEELDSFVETGSRFDERRWDIVNPEYRCTVATKAPSDQDEAQSIGAGLPVPERALLATMIRVAAHDGMEIRERVGFLSVWTDFEEQIPALLQTYPAIQTFLSLPVVNFWVALRRGWGAWRPSDSMLASMRGFLNHITGVDHAPPTPRRAGQISTISELVEQTILPNEEKERFLLLESIIPLVRIHRLFENWAAYEVTVDDTRLPSEEHFSRAELRLDRLERIIREERIINDHRSIRGARQGDSDRVYLFSRT
ncbi:uncharacterized protein LY89DRAFT_721774 [Mollisia scopiformis]|uniref:Uncharacterized protein n=1 Tax=Mollisia scopiformis TaxID=149040 RepID=A0A194WYB3_MOLSC|nr:uncharacterized protein LY89DRAFT_721774 [Mollisia scopiformis]KUJ12956.1 hypothetical protein LY89DRAFT_721774 [Mollisia scopiformis]